MSVLVRESARRKTAELVVDRDGTLTLLAPLGTPAEVLARFVDARRAWLYGKLERKRVQYRPPAPRAFRPGEGFWYAGRSYRLRLVDETPDTPALRLDAGWFELRRDRLADGRAIFQAWYAEHLRVWLAEQTARHARRLSTSPHAVRVADLGFKWGTCSANGDVTLHWRVALLPRRVAEYVLLHELAHLEHHHHGPAFWERLEMLVPDYAELKAWLARHGADYDV